MDRAILVKHAVAVNWRQTTRRRYVPRLDRNGPITGKDADYSGLSSPGARSRRLRTFAKQEPTVRNQSDAQHQRQLLV